MDKNELPKGWGEDYEDDDLEFSPFDIEDDEDSPWGTSSNSESNNTSIVSEKPNDECRAYRDDAISYDSTENDISDTHHSETIKENIDPQTSCTTNENAELISSNSDIEQKVYHSETIQARSHENYDDSLVKQDSISEQEKMSINGIVIGIIVFLFLVILVIGWLFIKQSRTTNDNTAPIQNMNSQITTEIVTTQIVEIIKTTTGIVTTESPTETDITVTTVTTFEESINNNISENSENIYNIYLDIINDMDFTIPMRGFLADINNDKIDELIIPDTYNMEYVLYYYSDGNIYTCKFGDFMALDNFVMYKVIGDNNENYIYYRDNYSYKSKQGYFSLKNMAQLNIYIDYPENNGKYSANWTINYNVSENYAKGCENVDTFYSQPDNCHNKLIEAFQYYNYGISEDSQYIKIDSMYYDELVKHLKSKTLVNITTEIQNPSVTAYIEKKSFYPNGDGSSFILHVSGNYSYYYYEGYYTGGGEYDHMCTSGNTFASEVEITAGSVMSEVRAVIIPYNDNGIAGETINVTYNNYVKANPCTQYGHINDHNETVPGYTTSYIVDNCEMSYVRTSLGDGWHITAVNWCVSKGITWYELYDYDDGDYYGWVDSTYIDFY